MDRLVKTIERLDKYIPRVFVSIFIAQYVLLLISNHELFNKEATGYCNSSGGLTGTCQRAPVDEIFYNAGHFLKLLGELIYSTLIFIAILWITVLLLQYVIKRKNHGT